MTVIYIIAKILTFPGAYLKSFFEHLVCRMLDMPIESAKYFRADELCGHVEHELARDNAKNVGVSFFPGLFMLLIGAPMTIAGWVNLIYLGVDRVSVDGTVTQPMFWFYIVLLYVGGSMLCNLFPLMEDALWLKDGFFCKAGVVQKILLFIPMCVVIVGSFLERYGLNILLALALLAYTIFM